MKGVIVGSFTAWVEQTRDLATCDAIIRANENSLSTGAAYTTVGDYPTAEFQALVQSLADLEGRSPDEILREFGRDAYPLLASLHPEMVDGMTDLPSLLTGIEGTIHTDVRKLYPNARPPLVTAALRPDGDIAVRYRSHRNLAALCHGLLEGALATTGDGGTVSLVDEKDDSGFTTADFLVHRGVE